MDSMADDQAPTLASILERGGTIVPARARHLLSSLASQGRPREAPPTPAGWLEGIRVRTSTDLRESAFFGAIPGGSAISEAGDARARAHVEALRVAAVGMLWGPSALVEPPPAPRADERLPRLRSHLVEQWATVRARCIEPVVFMSQFDSVLTQDDPRAVRPHFQTVSMKTPVVGQERITPGTLVGEQLPDTHKFERRKKPRPAEAPPAPVAARSKTPLMIAGAVVVLILIVGAVLLLR